MQRLKDSWPALAVIAALIAVWWAAVVVTRSAIFPTPWAVLTGTFELLEDGSLWRHIGASLMRVGAGFVLAVCVAVPLGLWMGWVRGAYRTLNPLFQILRPISPIAWIPIAILWFGVGDLAAVFLIFVTSFLALTVATMNAARNVDATHVRAGRNFGLSERQLVFRVLCPAMMPRIGVALRITLGVAWLVVVAAEMIAVRSGLGYLIVDARNAGNRYDLVVGGMALIGMIGLALDTAMRRLERLKSLRWGYEGAR